MAINAGIDNEWMARNNKGRTYASTSATSQNNIFFNIDAGVNTSYVGTGTDWLDLSGSGNNLTIQNSPTFSSDYGGSFILDGTDDYMPITAGRNTYDMSQTTSCSVSFWVKTNISPSTRQCIFGDWTSAGNQEGARGEFSGYGMTNGKIGVNLFGNNTTDNLNATSTISSGVWYYVVATRSGAVGSTGNLYINAVLEDTIIYNTSNGGGAGTFAIGRGGDYDGIYLNGSVVNFQFYNRALTFNEIRQNYFILNGRFD